MLKPQKPLPETRLSINTRYSPQLPSSLFPSLPLPLSFCHVGLCIVIYTTSSFKHRAIERKIAHKKNESGGSVVLLLKEHLSPCSSSESGSGLGKPGTRPRCCCCCCCCGLLPLLLLLPLLVWQVSRAIQKYFRTRPLRSPAACTLWFYNRDG